MKSVDIATLYVMTIIVIVVGAVIICKEKGFRPNDKDNSHPVHKGLVREGEER